MLMKLHINNLIVVVNKQIADAFIKEYFVQVGPKSYKLVLD